MWENGILLSIILQFVIIYSAVRLAIIPLLHKQDEIIKYKYKNDEIIGDEAEFDLVKLRDIEVLSDDELEDVIKLYQNKDAEKEGYELYQKYANVLNELNKMGYFTDEEYSNRMNKLKNYFEID